MENYLKKAAAEKYKINRTTVTYKMRGSHDAKSGRPTMLSTNKERLLTGTLKQPAHVDFQ